MLDEITTKKILFAFLAFMDDLDQPKLVSVTINTGSDHVKFERSHTVYEEMPKLKLLTQPASSTHGLFFFM